MTRQRFIIVGTQRSGTTVTHLCLRGHPGVSSLNDEVKVSPLFTEGVATFTYGAETEIEREKGFLALFDALTTIDAREETTAQGLKVAINSHQEAVDFANCLRTRLRPIKVILVHRDDLVAQCGSWLRGQRTGKWHSWAGAPVGDSTMIHIDEQRFAEYAHENLRIVAQLRTLARTHEVLEFEFERDITGGAGFARLFDFLDLPVMPVTWLRSEKISPPPEEYIENHAALRALRARVTPPSVEDEQAEADRQLLARFDRLSDEDVVEAGVRAAVAGGPDAAELHRQALLARKHGEPWAAYLSGRILEKGRDFAAAIERYDRFLAAHADHPIGLVHRGFCRLRLGDPRGTHEDVVAALQCERFKRLIRPTQRWSFEILEIAWQRLYDGKLAKHWLAVLGPEFDDNPFFHYLRAVVHNAAGDLETGRAALRRAVELAPDFDRARARLEEWQKV